MANSNHPTDAQVIARLREFLTELGPNDPRREQILGFLRSKKQIRECVELLKIHIKTTEALLGHKYEFGDRGNPDPEATPTMSPEDAAAATKTFLDRLKGPL